MKKSKFVFCLLIYLFVLKSIESMRLKFKNRQEEDDYRNKLLYMLNMDSLNNKNNEIFEINCTNNNNETISNAQNSETLQKKINEKESLTTLIVTKRNITSKENNTNLQKSLSRIELENVTYINMAQSKKAQENNFGVRKYIDNISLMNQNVHNENSLNKNIPKLLLPIIINKKTQIQLPKRDNSNTNATIPSFDNYLHQAVNSIPSIKSLPPLTIIPVVNQEKKTQLLNRIYQTKVPIGELDIIESKIKKIDALSETEVTKRK